MKKIVVISILLIISVAGFLGIRFALAVYELKTETQKLMAMAIGQNYAALNPQTKLVQTKLHRLNFWWWPDGKRLANTGSEVLSAFQIVSEVISADLIKTSQFLLPKLPQIQTHVTKANTSINQVGLDISYINVGKELLGKLEAFVKVGEPALKSLPYLFGVDNPRKYLVLLHNDAELRPTGGFMTAFAIAVVDNGQITIEQSGDIYSLDEKVKNRLPSPEPIKNYLPNVPYWHLRDQNLSPDFKVSMETFYPNYLQTGMPAVDGVIAVNTKLLVDLVRLSGPIEVPGYGKFSADVDKRCNCPQVFYALELLADTESSDIAKHAERKSFIGPMAGILFERLKALSGSQMFAAVSTILSNIGAKNIQLYFPEPVLQGMMESLNLAGRVQDYPGDYLMIVDSNFAGAKTNAWVTYDAKQEIAIAENGTIVKTLTLVYKNPQQDFQDVKTKLKLNGVFRDWLRIFVPKGSVLIETKGLDTGQKTSEDLNKTVFEGFFVLNPLNQKTIIFKYQLPFKAIKPYKLLTQKQAGAKDFVHKIFINGWQKTEFKLDSDHEFVQD